MSQYFIDKLVYNNDTLDIHDTEARDMIQAVSARVTKNANDIDALEEIAVDLREDVDNIDDRMGVAETEIDGLKTRTTNLEGRTTNLEGRMNTAENRLDGHDTKISDLEDRMDTAENNIIALDGRMTAAENDIDAAEHRLDLVEAKNDEQDISIDDLEENVAKNTADIVDIKDDLTGVHKNIEDLDDRITASTYEAGIGIYFGQGAEHTNINVEDEILDQINQNTIDIQNLKTRVTNVENRLTTVEGDIVSIKGDITDIKAEITSIKADITALEARVTALEGKMLPAGGTKGQYLRKASDSDYDAYWGDIDPYDYWHPGNISQYTYPGKVNYKCVIDNKYASTLDVSSFSDLIPFKKMQSNSRLIIEQIAYGNHKRITVSVNTSTYLGDNSFVLTKFDDNPWRLDDNFPVSLGRFSTSTPLSIDNIPAYSNDTYMHQILDPANNITVGHNGIPCFKVTVAGSRDVYYAEVNAQNGNIKTHGIYSNIDITIPMIEAFTLEVNIMTGTLVSLTSKSISLT